MPKDIGFEKNINAYLQKLQTLIQNSKSTARLADKSGERTAEG
jgi:hypothetical protein